MRFSGNIGVQAWGMVPNGSSLRAGQGVWSGKITSINRRESMKRIALFGLVVLALSSQGATAQQAGDNLSDQQKAGRQVFAQSCGVCHLPPSLGAKTYGPPLNKEAAR